MPALSLHLVITDRRDAPAVFEAAVAALTGQPVSVVAHEMAAARESLSRRSPRATVRTADIEVVVRLLLTLGYAPSHTRAVGRLTLRAVLEARAAGGRQTDAEPALLVQLDDGAAHVFCNQVAAGDCSDAPQTIVALVDDGALCLDAHVRHCVVLNADGIPVPIQAPDHQFLVAATNDALQLAMRHRIRVERLEWPYWRMILPEDIVVRSRAANSIVLCGPLQLLRTIEQYVQARHWALEADRRLIRQDMRRP